MVVEEGCLFLMGDNRNESRYDQTCDQEVIAPTLRSEGIKQIYDGSFSGKLIKGQGVFAEMLKRAGIKIVDVEDLSVKEKNTGKKELLSAD